MVAGTVSPKTITLPSTNTEITTHITVITPTPTKGKTGLQASAAQANDLKQFHEYQNFLNYTTE